MLGAADDLEGEGHVLVGGLVGEQLEVLEDAADVAAQVRYLPVLHLGQVLSGHDDRALGGHELTQQQTDP